MIYCDLCRIEIKETDHTNIIEYAGHVFQVSIIAFPLPERTNQRQPKDICFECKTKIARSEIVRGDNK